jgi:hypothetical protein
VQAGGTVAFHTPDSWPARAEAQLLTLLSQPPASGPALSPEDWLGEHPPFPGGNLLHLGGSLRLEAGDGRLACLLLAAASGGQRVPAGLLGLWRLEAEAGAWSAQGLLGACSAEYRLPEGELYPGAWAAGLRLEARAGQAFRLAGSWRRRVDRPPAVPEGNLPGTGEGKLAARLEVPLRAGGRLEARAEASARGDYAAEGGVERSAAGGLDLALRGNPGGLGLELRGSWKEDGAELRGQLWGERRGVRVRAGARGQAVSAQAASVFRWRPFGRLELAGKDFLFWISAGGGDSGRETSLGWSASQRLPASPTSRTSRSRR